MVAGSPLFEGWSGWRFESLGTLDKYTSNGTEKGDLLK